MPAPRLRPLRRLTELLLVGVPDWVQLASIRAATLGTRLHASPCCMVVVLSTNVRLPEETSNRHRIHMVLALRCMCAFANAFVGLRRNPFLILRLCKVQRPRGRDVVVLGAPTDKTRRSVAVDPTTSLSPFSAVCEQRTGRPSPTACVLRPMSAQPGQFKDCGKFHEGKFKGLPLCPLFLEDS